MTLLQLAVAGLAVLCGGVLNGVAGFGFALVAVPILLWALPPTSVIWVSAALVGLTAAGVAIRSRADIDRRIVGWLLSGAVFGLWAGSWALATLPAVTLALIANSAVVLFALMLAIPAAPRLELSVPVLVLAGILSGTLTTMAGLPGPPTVLVLSSARVPKDVMRATVAAFLTVNSLVGVTLLVARGLVASGDVLLVLGLAPAALIGLVGGAGLAQRLSQDAYRMLVLGVVAIAGAAGVITILFT